MTRSTRCAAVCAKEAVAVLSACRPDVVLLDLSLPGIDGFETMRRLRAKHPAVRILVLTSNESAAAATRALREGACGYVSKNIDHGAIVAAIRAIHGGASGIRRGVAAEAVAGSRSLLTGREMDVLRLMRQGLTNAEIGRRLSISERTVKGHVTFIIEKLGAADRTGAVARAFDLGLLMLQGTRT
jgi:DNA-binding NarL/FixJ family response regulator